ncbi:acyl-CoA thioesterase [Candidatus Woesearchaeota archaeon]|nr:acyl-CoA thioesterase [Candidatus Woesearchaeota archaeon]
MKINKTEVRVYYSDTDRGGVVYYSNYLKWFEVGRTELLREQGLSYAEFEKQNLIAPVVDVRCTYHDSAKYDDVITIETSIEKIGNSSIKFLYKLLRRNTLLAEGYTVNVFVDMKTKKSSRIPDKLREAFST